jgi:hypothetical protein
MDVYWFFLESTRKVYFNPFKEKNASQLAINKLLWCKLCKSNLAQGFLRDLGVNMVMIQIFLTLPLSKKVTWLTESLTPRKDYPSWNGEPLSINQTDHTETIAVKWLPVFQELNKVPFKEVGWWACANFTEPEYRWIGCSGISPHGGLFFKM